MTNMTMTRSCCLWVRTVHTCRSHECHEYQNWEPRKRMAFFEDQSKLRRTRYHLLGHGPQNGALSKAHHGQVMARTFPFLRLLWNLWNPTPCAPWPWTHQRPRRSLGCRAVELEHLPAAASSGSPLHQSRCQKGLPMSDERVLLRFRGRPSDFRDRGGFCKLHADSQSPNLLYSNETLWISAPWMYVL